MYQTTPAPELIFSNEEATVADQEIATLLVKKAIAPCDHEPGEFISDIFL